MLASMLSFLVITAFQWRLNGVILAGSVDIQMSVVKCTIMYWEKMAGPRSANFDSHMHVDSVSSSANFHPNRQRP